MNDIVRHEYRVLSEGEKRHMQHIKDSGAEFYTYCKDLGSSRELNLAMTKIEEAVMWAVKHITRPL